MRRSPLAVIFLTVFLDLLGFGIVIPLLSLYAEQLHAADWQITVLMTIYSVMQLIFSPIWGRLSDRAGRRPVLLLSILGSCGSQFGYAFAPSLVWLVVARGFAGMCGANVTAAQAYVADCTDEKSRAAGMGTLGAALGLGFVFGPALGGILSRYSATLPFLVAGGLAGINFVLAYFILEEPRPPSERTHARTLTWDGLGRAVSSPRLRTILFLYFIVTFGFANLEGTFSLFLERQFHYGRDRASYLFCYIGAIIVLVQGGFVRRLAPKFGERALVIAGTLCMAVGFFLQYLSTDLTMLLVAIGVMSVGNALNTPSLSSLISRAAGSDQQGGVLGVGQALGALARIAGPALGIWLLHFEVRMPYAVGGGFMLGACVYAAVAVRQPPEKGAS